MLLIPHQRQTGDKHNARTEQVEQRHPETGHRN